jgi:hypothetical protein
LAAVEAAPRALDPDIPGCVGMLSVEHAETK